MKRAIVFLLSILFLPSLVLAATADVSLTASVAPTTVTGGETTWLSIHLVNAGPEAAGATTLSIGLDVAYADTSVSPAARDCSLGNGSVTCRWASLPVGASDLIFTLFSNVAKVTPLYVAVYTTAEDPTPDDHLAQLQLNVTPSGYADVRIEDSHDPQLVPQGTSVTFASTVRNNGPAGTSSVTVDDDLYGLGQNFTISNVSDGWSCYRPEATVVHCLSAGLAPYSSRELRYSAKVPDALVAVSRNSTVYFGGATLPQASRNWAQDSFAVGTSDDFERMLLPVVMAETPGSFGSRWISKFVAMADTPDVLLFPTSGVCQVTCPAPPPYGYPLPQFPTEPYLLGNFSDISNPGRLIYTLKGTSTHLHMNLRVQDLSRQSQTWGSELPIIHETEARMGKIELLNVPLDDRFRQTLRFYDLDARGDSQVRVRLYGTSMYGWETTVAEVLLPLRVPENNTVGNAIGLPVRPGYAQLEGLPQRFPQLANFTKLRVEVEPITPGLRYWAFASITNNETQHVTTITPQ